VLTIVTGEGPELGPSLIGAVDFVMFTGSTRTGQVIASQAAPRLIGYSLELGGKNPMLVLADADLGRAVDGAIRGCFVGAGQVCVSIERIFVHESIFAPFLDGFVQRAKKLRMSASLDYDGEMGSLTSVRQLNTVKRHVDDAIAKGAMLRTGGRVRADIGPLFYEPTILTDVRPEMVLYDEETFGPVVAVYPFENEDEAIWPQRERVVAQPGSRRARCVASSGRDRERERGIRGDVGLGRRTHWRRQAIGREPATRT
jgi:acyl-CoA reductase-like NAD-dependent aldehyde dehydrogenase